MVSTRRSASLESASDTSRSREDGLRRRRRVIRPTPMAPRADLSTNDRLWLSMRPMIPLDGNTVRFLGKVFDMVQANEDFRCVPIPQARGYAIVRYVDMSEESDDTVEDADTIPDEECHTP